jgi:hypothetical protein
MEFYQLNRLSGDGTSYPHVYFRMPVIMRNFAREVMAVRRGREGPARRNNRRFLIGVVKALT